MRRMKRADGTVEPEPIDNLVLLGVPLISSFPSELPFCVGRTTNKFVKQYPGRNATLLSGRQRCTLSPFRFAPVLFSELSTPPSLFRPRFYHNRTKTSSLYYVLSTCPPVSANEFFEARSSDQFAHRARCTPTSISGTLILILILILILPSSTKPPLAIVPGGEVLLASNTLRIPQFDFYSTGLVWGPFVLICRR